MRKTRQVVHIVTVAMFLCVLFSSCRYRIDDEKRVDVISDIAVIVNDNYTSEDVETPYEISMTEIDELADKNSDLHRLIEKNHADSALIVHQFQLSGMRFRFFR